MLKNKRHPLEDEFPVEKRVFEKCIWCYDLLIFDYGQSTTFPKALCTKIPIVYLDLKTSIHDESVAELINKRCARIDVQFDGKINLSCQI